MATADFILILILFFFSFAGFWFGLIHSLGALIGTVAGIVVAGHYFEWLTEIIEPIFGNNINLAKIISFLVIFIIVNRLVGLVFWLINKIFNVISIIPFLKSINRLLGALLGLAEGIIVLGILLIMVGKFPFADFIIPALEESQMAEWLIHVGNLLMPLLPELVAQAKTYLPF
jgi:membrane protein required for colicin V production